MYPLFSKGRHPERSRLFRRSEGSRGIDPMSISGEIIRQAGESAGPRDDAVMTPSPAASRRRKIILYFAVGRKIVQNDWAEIT